MSHESQAHNTRSRVLADTAEVGPIGWSGYAHVKDADTAIMLTRPSNNKPTIIELDFRLRSAADPKPIRLMLDEDTFTFDRTKNE